MDKIFITLNGYLIWEVYETNEKTTEFIKIG